MEARNWGIYLYRSSHHDREVCAVDAVELLEAHEAKKTIADESGMANRKAAAEEFPTTQAPWPPQDPLNPQALPTSPEPMIQERTLRPHWQSKKYLHEGKYISQFSAASKYPVEEKPKTPTAISELDSTCTR